MMPKYKMGVWDGKISFLSNDKLLPIGLYKELLFFCEKYHYEPVLNFDKSLIDPKELDNDFLDKFLSEIPLSEIYEIRDYQLESFKKMIKHRFAVSQLNTGLGKSLVIYLLALYSLKQEQKVLIIVPSINLVNQLYTDFIDYGFTDLDNLTRVCSKVKEKFNPESKIVISTWQSQYLKESLGFSHYGTLIIDEVHGVSGTGKSIQEIVKKCSKVKYRWGLTGTLSNDKCDLWTVFGYVGRLVMETRSSDYIERGVLSDIQIQNVFVTYPPEICQKIRNLNYQDEINYIYGYSARNNVLKDILKNVGKDENVLILVTRIEKQILPIEKYLKEEFPDKEIYTICGGTDGDEREVIRKTMEEKSGVILLASYGTLSTGVNIRKLHHIVFFSSYKSKIKVLQSIGRGLRTHDSKSKLMLWDVVDDLRIGRHRNFSYKHFEERLKYYQEQGFKKCGQKNLFEYK